MSTILARRLSAAGMRVVLVTLALGLGAAAMRGVPPAAAQAQSQPQDAPGVRNADDLLREGEALMKAAEEKVAQACVVLEQRELVLPSAPAKLALATCREQNGQLATALRLYTSVVAETRATRAPGSVALYLRAEERISSLAPRLSRLALLVDAERLPGLQVFRNGEPVPAEQWNQPWPLDGGVYQLSAQAPGFSPWSGVISLENEGERQTLTLSPSVKPAISASLDFSDPPLLAPSSNGIPSQRFPKLAQRADVPALAQEAQPARTSRRGRKAKGAASPAAEVAPSNDSNLPMALGVAALTFGGVALGLEVGARKFASSAAWQRRAAFPGNLTGGNAAEVARRELRAAELHDSARRRHLLAQGAAVVAVGTAAVATYLWIRHLRSESSSRQASNQFAPTFSSGDGGSVAGVQLSGQW